MRFITLALHLLPFLINYLITALIVMNINYCQFCLILFLRAVFSSTARNCPSVFISIIDEMSEPGSQLIPGTNCAEKCISPVWSHSEWKLLLTLCTVAMWVGMPLDILVIITWSCSKKKRNQYFVLAFAICSFIMQFTLVVSSFYSFDDIHCSNAAVPMSYRDGFTVCNVQSFLFVYGSIGAGISWMLQSFDLYIKVVLKKNDTKRYKSLCLTLIFGVPLFILLTVGVTRSYGYQPGIPMCMISGIYTTYCIYVPVLLCLIFGAAAIFAVIFVIVRHSRKLRGVVAAGTSQSNGNELFKMVKGSALFVLSFFVLSIPVHTYRLYYYIYFHDGATVEIADWSSWHSCIFQHYDGVDDVSWVSVCGAVPPHRVPLALAVFQGLSAHGTGLLVSSTYLIQPSFWRIWKSWLKLDGGSPTSSLYSRKLVVKRQSVENGNRSVDPGFDRSRTDGGCSEKKAFMSCNSVEINVKDKYLVVDVRSEKCSRK